MKKWLKNKLAIISLAASNVEKNAFGQNGETLSTDVSHAQRHTKGQLVDSLINGEITQEVMDLRWRTYKVLNEAQNYVSKVIGYDNEGYPIMETKKINIAELLIGTKTEPTDEYPLELVLINDDITISVVDVMGSQYIEMPETPTLHKNDLGEVTGATHGVISSEEYFSTYKNEKPLSVTRDFHPKFNIEKYTKKVHVKTIDENEKLIELYISKYPDDNRASTIFVNTMKKLLENPISSNILEIKGINFVTYKTLGVKDLLYYEYEVLSFDKIVEFDGNYVVKYKTKVITEAESMIEKYRQEELDEKYKNNEKKNN